MDRCTKCGSPISPNDRFCGACGTPIGPENPPVRQVRCAHCGGVVPEGGSPCKACGTHSMSAENYAKRVERGRKALALRKRHGAGALVMVWLLLLCILGTAVFLYLWLGGEDLLDWLDDVEVLPQILAFAIPVCLLLGIFGWSHDRRKAIQKSGLTALEYKDAMAESKALPRAFYDPIPDGTEPKAKKKKTPAQRGYGRLIVWLTIFVLILSQSCVKLYENAADTDTGLSLHSLLGNVLPMADVDGHVFATKSTSSGGMTTVGIAYFFDNGTMYVGQRGDSNAEFRRYSSSYGTSGAKYFAIGNVVIVIGSGVTHLYIYDGDKHTLTRGGTVLKRVR